MGFVILTLFNCGGPSGPSTVRPHPGNYSPLLQSPHLPWPPIILPLLVTLCKTLLIFSGADISAPRDPCPTSRALGGTFFHFRPAVESDQQTVPSQYSNLGNHECRVDTKCSIESGWLALSVIRRNLFSYLKGRPFLLPPWREHRLHTFRITTRPCKMTQTGQIAHGANSDSESQRHWGLSHQSRPADIRDTGLQPWAPGLFPCIGAYEYAEV